MNSNMMKWFGKACAFVAVALFAGNAWAAYKDFASDAMSAASGFSGGSVSGWTMTVTDATKLQYVERSTPDSLNRQARGWYAGATIQWPQNGATDGRAEMKTTRMASTTSGENPGSGNGLTVTTYKPTVMSDTKMDTTTWWSWITPEEAYAAKGGDFKISLHMRATNQGVTKGVNDADFYITIPTAGLELNDDKGIQWYPVVATNGTTAKVYGDLNVALKDGGEVVSVAKAAITNAITLEAGVTFKKGDYNVTGLDNLTLRGGSYDFQPSKEGCTIAKGCIEEFNAGTQLWDVENCTHDWAFSTDGATFTATCSKGCSYTPQTVTIKIDQASKTYDGTELTASLEYNTSASEFTTQTGATVGAIEWEGDKKSVGEQKASVTITAGDQPYTITATLTIEPAPMSTATVTLQSATMNFADKELTNGVSSVTAPGISTSDWEIVDPTALYGAGSGYSNVTYTVTLNGKKNFDGTTTATWTILAPTGAFASNAMGRGDFDVSSSSSLYNENYGEAVGRTLTVADSTKIIFVNGHWFVGATVEVPNDVRTFSPSKSQITPDENLRVTVSTTGKTYTGTWLYENREYLAKLAGFQVLDDDHSSQWWLDLGTFQYFKKIRWFTEISPAMVEQAKLAGKDELTFTLTVGGITGRWEGLKYTDFVIKAPLDGFVFKVGRNEFNTADIGNVAFSTNTPSIQLIADSVVTNACAIDYTDKKRIFTEVANYDVFETEVSDTCWVYSCEREIVTITVPNVANQASKVVKARGTEVNAIDADKTQYKVHGGDTVTIDYTAAAGYLPPTANKTMTDVKNGDTLDDLPVFTWPNVKVTPEMPENVSKAEVWTNGVKVGESPCEVVSNDMVTVVYLADDGYFFYDEELQAYSTSNKLEAVSATNDPMVVSKAGALPVVSAVAKIGTTYYPTLDAAIDAAKTNDTITLLKACKSDGEAIDLPLTLDQNGNAVTNLTLGAGAVLTLKGETESPNKLRSEKPEMFNNDIANGAKVVTRTTYVYFEAFDAFYEEGHEVVATTYGEGGVTFLESYATFTNALANVATNGTVYALKEKISTPGFIINRNMTIDLEKTNPTGTNTLTITSPYAAKKTTGIYVDKKTTDVIVKGGKIAVAVGSGICTLVETASGKLSLADTLLDGAALDAAKTPNTLTALNGGLFLTNANIRATNGYALNVSCYASATGITVTCSAGSIYCENSSNVLLNVRKDVPVKLQFADCAIGGTFDVNAFASKTVVTKSWATDDPKLNKPEYGWTQGAEHKLVFGVAQVVGAGAGYYPTFKEAVEAAASGDTIILLNDAKSPMSYEIKKTFTLDLNGHTLAQEKGLVTLWVKDGAVVTVYGTNENSRVSGNLQVESTVTLRGGRYDLVNCLGTVVLDGVEMLRTESNKSCLMTDSKSRLLTVLNSRVVSSGRVVTFNGGGLVVSNTIIQATETGRAISVAGGKEGSFVKLLEGTQILSTEGTDQLYWNTNNAAQVSITKKDGIDCLAQEGFGWTTNGVEEGFWKLVPSTTTYDVMPLMFTKNLFNLAPAMKLNPAGQLTLDSDAAVKVGDETVEVKPDDFTITVGDTADVITVKSIPDLTYELLAKESLAAEWTVVETKVATSAETAFTAKKDGAAARFYTVRVRY